MNPDYLDKWPESYPVTLDAVREYLYGRPRIGDPTSWRQCAEFFDNPSFAANHGICYWMDDHRNPTALTHDDYDRLSEFFKVLTNNRRMWIWPTRPEFAPRRAVLCRTVAARLEELQLNPPAA